MSYCQVIVVESDSAHVRAGAAVALLEVEGRNAVEERASAQGYTIGGRALGYVRSLLTYPRNTQRRAEEGDVGCPSLPVEQAPGVCSCFFSSRVRND